MLSCPLAFVVMFSCSTVPFESTNLNSAPSRVAFVFASSFVSVTEPVVPPPSPPPPDAGVQVDVCFVTKSVPANLAVLSY